MEKLLKSISAFTVVELMVVVALVCILAAISLTQYRAYINRGKCTEVEVAAHDTLLALTRELADSGSAPTGAGYANSHTLPSGQVLNYPANVLVSYSGNGTQANPFTVNATRSNPVCTKGDGTYSLVQGQSSGTW